MKSFITGYKGQLGYDLLRELEKRGELDVVVSDLGDLDSNLNERSLNLLNKLNVKYKNLDITDEKKVNEVINEIKPDVIYHCAAWTNVDAAEDKEELCYSVNVIGTRNLTKAAKSVGAKIIYISSDYVFDGTKDGIYTEDDIVNPISVYGKTKYQGEEEVRRYDKHYIVRISWVYGINGNNFVKTMLKLSEKYDTLTVVNDQIGSPTYTVDVSKLLVDMACVDKYGTYHGTNENYCSWALFASEIFKMNNINVDVKGITTDEYYKDKKAAKRPLNSKLSKEKLKSKGFNLLSTWQDALVRYTSELKKEDEEISKIIKRGRN